jgi:hypothetical protein
MKDKAARTVRSRRKMLAKRYTKRLGQRCVWLNGSLVIRLRAPRSDKNVVPVQMKGGRAVTLTKHGVGTAANRA